MLSSFSCSLKASSTTLISYLIIFESSKPIATSLLASSSLFTCFSVKLAVLSQSFWIYDDVMPNLTDSPSEDSTETDLIGYWLRFISSCIIMFSSSSSSSTGSCFFIGLIAGANIFGASTGATLAGWMTGDTAGFAGAECVIKAFSNISLICLSLTFLGSTLTN